MVILFEENFLFFDNLIQPKRKYISFPTEDGPYRKPIPLMLHMDNVETPSSFALPNDEAPSFALPNDEAQGGMQEKQGGNHDTTKNGTYVFKASHFTN